MQQVLELPAVVNLAVLTSSVWTTPLSRSTPICAFVGPTVPPDPSADPPHFRNTRRSFFVLVISGSRAPCQRPIAQQDTALAQVRVHRFEDGARRVVSFQQVVEVEDRVLRALDAPLALRSLRTVRDRIVAQLQPGEATHRVAVVEVLHYNRSTGPIAIPSAAGSDSAYHCWRQ